MGKLGSKRQTLGAPQPDSPRLAENPSAPQILLAAVESSGEWKTLKSVLALYPGRFSRIQALSVFGLSIQRTAPPPPEMEGGRQRDFCIALFRPSPTPPCLGKDLRPRLGGFGNRPAAFASRTRMPTALRLGSLLSLPRPLTKRGGEVEPEQEMCHQIFMNG